ncbi:MAG: hypothetical protein BM555_00220 [Crocinitomix sp. MedPE-SWsnd]|nr:MAG: hypothetical protein BM555_00220 [Crocinitomix sp. MedPE-SWsnd]
MWEGLVPKFVKEGFQCIFIDLPCHGNSRFEGENCSMKHMALQVNLLINELNIQDEITVVGHSMGGYVALELNGLRPCEVILLHSNFWADGDQKKTERNRVIDIVEKNKALFIKEAIPNLFAPFNKEKCHNDIRLLVNGAIENPVNEIQAATAGMRDRDAFYKLNNDSTLHIIHGEFDPIISTAKMNEELANFKGQHELIVLKGVGHMSIWENESLLIKRLMSIISQ